MKKVVSLRRLLEDAQDRNISLDDILADPSEIRILDDDTEYESEDTGGED